MFFVNQTFLNNINSIDGSGIISPSAIASADWLLVPKSGAGGTDPAGMDYTVQAFIDYTVDGVPFSVNSTEERINVMPQPLLNLTYMIPGEVKADTPFNITLNVTNVGYGTARNLKLDSAQPVIYENKAGLLVSFELIGSGIKGGAESDSMLINFGDIAPGESKTGYWIMITSLDGEFTEFKGSFSHSNALGGAETSLIENVTYVITKFTAEIISPVDGGIYYDFEPIYFEGTAHNGTEPFTYEWRTYYGGLLSSEPSFNEKLSAGSHEIKLIVTDKNGITDIDTHLINVNRETIGVSVGAKYNQESKKLDISAYAVDKSEGRIVNSGVVKYEILDFDGNPTGFNGDLLFNSNSKEWEINNLNILNLAAGDYNVKVIIKTPTGYGIGELPNPFIKLEGYGSLFGYLIDGTKSTPENKVTMSNVEVSLYISNDFYKPNAQPIAIGETDSTGMYNFDEQANGEPLSPAYYVIVTEAYNQRYVSEAFRVGAERLQFDTWVYDKLSILDPKMESLYKSYTNVMEYETGLMAEISGRFHKDLGYDVDGYDITLSLLSIFTNPDFPTDNLFYMKLSKGEYLNLMGKYVFKEMGKEAFKEGPVFLNSIISEDLTKKVLNMNSGLSENEIKSSDYYQNVEGLLDNKHKDFTESSPKINLTNEFDINDAKKVISDQKIQLSDINSGFGSVIIPSDPADKVAFLSLRDSYGSYMDTVVSAERNKWTNRGIKTTIIISKTVLISTGYGIATMVFLENWVATPIMASSEMEYKHKISENGALSYGSWVTDLSKIPNSYEQTSDFLISEAKNPYYLAKSNDFSEDLKYESNTLKEGTSYEKPVEIKANKNHWYSNKWIGSEKDPIDGEITVNIKNTGNVKSTYRVFSQGVVDRQTFWSTLNLDMPFFNVGVDIGSIPIAISKDFDNLELTPNQQGSMTLNFKGYYFFWNNYNPHRLMLTTFSGPFEIDRRLYFYRVVDPEDNIVNSRTINGILTEEEDSIYLPSISKILSDNLTSNNSVISKTFTTRQNTSSLELDMISSFGTPVDLHVYDEKGRHVGYNILTDSEETEFPAIYRGRFQNPEQIIIPNAGNKTFTIQVNLTYSDYPTTTQITVYALETPERPAILTVSSMDIIMLTNHNQTVPIDLFVAESGGQHPIHTVNATIMNITKDGIELPLLSPQKIEIGDLSAGSAGNATFILDVPGSIPDGNYTGIINVDSEIGPYPVKLTIHVTSKPDLKVSFIDVNRTVLAGNSTNITVIAGNQGFTNVTNTKLELLVDDVLIESRTLDITSETLEVYTFNWNAVSGNHILKARIDPDDLSDEFNENNNEFEISINVNSVADINPPSSITNFHYTNSTTWINWTWTNPPDPDFNHTEIYLDGSFQRNTSEEYFNATDLDPNMEYEISTRTVDDLGNLNETWVNDTTTTLNTPPVSNASGPYIGIEGQAIIFNASASYDPDPGDSIISFEWDFNNDWATDATGMEVNWTWNDDYAGQVNLTVTDSHGESNTNTTSVNVLNAPPEVEAGNNQTVNEGDIVIFIGDFTDPGTDDTHTIEWNFGDGTPGSTGTLEPTHVYADNGTYTVTLTVTDDDGASTSDTLNVTVENVAPIVDAGEEQTTNEGDIVSFVGSFTDPGTADTHLIEWDFGDATPISSGILTPTHVYADNGTYAVNLTVTDDDGASTLDTLIVTVNNVAPLLDEVPDQTVQWGDTMTFSGSFTDPGDDSWTAEIDWGDGSQEEGTLSSKTITATHVYSIPGEYICILTVLDDDGGVGSGDMQITVTTRATELEYIGDLSAQYSDYINLKAQLNDSENFNPLPDKTINFILGTQTATATTGPDGIATTSFKLDQPAGSYDIKAEFAGDESYSPDNDTKAMQISREDAEITYTGDTILPSTAGSIDLRATLEEIDTDYGDLTTINVNFTIYQSGDPSYSNPIATVSSVTSSGMGVGTATATIENLPEDDYMIIARIAPNDYYQSISSNPTPMIVYEPTGQFTTGGGWIWDPTGSHGNFGFNVKYNKKGKVQGNSIYVYRLDGFDYIVKSNAWIGLAISDNTSTFQGKAVLQIFDPVTSELQPESSGNFQFTVEALDNELNGNPDYYKITVLDKDGLEYHNATGSLEGGNIVIHDKKSK